MATNKEINLKINGVDIAVKNIKDLDTALEMMNEELQTLDVGSAAFAELSKEIRKANFEMENLEKTLEGDYSLKVAESFAKMGEGIAGGFAIATNASALFGEESTAIAKAEAKAQQAIAIVMGARAISESIVEGATSARLVKEKLLLGVEKLKILNTTILNTLLGANTVATVTQTAATEGATIAQKALNIAMKASPIGLLIAGITALIGAVAYFTSSNDEASNSQKDLNSNLLIGIENSQKINELYLKSADKKIELLKLQGAGEETILKKQLERNQTEIEMAKTQEGLALSGIYISKRKLKDLDAESEAYTKVREDLDKYISISLEATKKRAEVAYNNATSFLNEANRITKSAIDAGKKVADEEIKKEEDAKKRRDEKLADNQKLQDQIALSQIERIADEETRELDKLRFDNDKQVEDIKNSKASKELKTAALIELDNKYNNDVDKITEKFRLKRIEDQKKEEEEKERIRLESLQFEKDFNRKIEDSQIDLNIKQKELLKNSTDSIKKKYEIQRQIINDNLSKEKTIIQRQYDDDKIALDKALKDKIISEEKYAEDLKKLNDKKNSEIKIANDNANLNSQKTSEEQYQATVNSINNYATMAAGAINDVLTAIQATREQKREEELYNIDKSASDEQKIIDRQLKLGQISQEEADRLKYESEKKRVDAENRVKEKAFEEDKKMKMAQIVISTLTGSLQAFSGAMSLGPIAGPIVGGILAGVVNATGAIAFNNVKKTKFRATEAPQSPIAGGGDIGGATTNMNNNSTLFNADTINQSGTLSNNNPSVQQQSPIKVNLLESDVTKTQKKVNMAESLGSF